MHSESSISGIKFCVVFDIFLSATLSQIWRFYNLQLK